MKFRNNPIKNRRIALVMFLSFIGLFLLTAKLTDKPNMNMKDGKTMSARVNPCHL